MENRHVNSSYFRASRALPVIALQCSRSGAKCRWGFKVPVWKWFASSSPVGCGWAACLLAHCHQEEVVLLEMAALGSFFLPPLLLKNSHTRLVQWSFYSCLHHLLQQWLPPHTADAITPWRDKYPFQAFCLILTFTLKSFGWSSYL